MNTFNFVSHESFIDDQYISESVILCFENRYRVTYIRKRIKNGGMFWDVISTPVMQNGHKRYLKSYSQDSNFLRQDVMSFLTNRVWENAKPLEQKIDDSPF